MRKTNFFFFPLISKFLLTLIKRKKKNTPVPPMCPPLPLLQAFKGRKLRDVSRPGLGAALHPPHGTHQGFLGCQAHAVQMPRGRRGERQVRNLVTRSCQEHSKSPRKATAQPFGQQTPCWRMWMCPEMHFCVPRASQPEFGFAPWLGDAMGKMLSTRSVLQHCCELSWGDVGREKPPPSTLSLEAINKSTPHLEGPSADSASPKAGCLKALPRSPNFLVPLPSLQPCGTWRGCKPPVSPTGRW